MNEDVLYGLVDDFTGRHSNNGPLDDVALLLGVGLRRNKN